MYGVTLTMTFCCAKESIGLSTSTPNTSEDAAQDIPIYQTANVPSEGPATTPEAVGKKSKHVAMMQECCTLNLTTQDI